MCLAKLEISLTYVMTEFLSASCITPCTWLGCPSSLLHALRMFLARTVWHFLSGSLGWSPLVNSWAELMETKDFRSAIDLGFFQAKPLSPRKSSSCSHTISWPLWTNDLDPHPDEKWLSTCRARVSAPKLSLFLGSCWGFAVETFRGSHKPNRPQLFFRWNMELNQCTVAHKAPDLDLQQTLDLVSQGQFLLASSLWWSCGWKSSNGYLFEKSTLLQS